MEQRSRRSKPVYQRRLRCLTHIPFQFHFATILSPWIRRALVAGGFGVGGPASSSITEIAAVVPYRDLQVIKALEKTADVEETPVINSFAPSGSESSAPVVLENTPFFHLDIVQAVRAAETSARRAEADDVASTEESDAKFDI